MPSSPLPFIVTFTVRFIVGKSPPVDGVNRGKLPMLCSSAEGISPQQFGNNGIGILFNEGGNRFIRVLNCPLCRCAAFIISRNFGCNNGVRLVRPGNKSGNFIAISIQFGFGNDSGFCSLTIPRLAFIVSSNGGAFNNGVRLVRPGNKPKICPAVVHKSRARFDLSKGIAASGDFSANVVRNAPFL